MFPNMAKVPKYLLDNPFQMIYLYTGILFPDQQNFSPFLLSSGPEIRNNED
jgi:hypothetical protein